MKKMIFSVLLCLVFIAGGTNHVVASDEYQPGPLSDPEEYQV